MCVKYHKQNYMNYSVDMFTRTLLLLNSILFSY